MTAPTTCRTCGTGLAPAADYCGTCATPADTRGRAGDKSSCRHCKAPLWSGAEACPSCGKRGYPALGPRFGAKSRRSPDWEERHA